MLRAGGHDDILMAAAMADIAIGTAPELSTGKTEAAADRYYNLLADAHGIEPLEDADALITLSRHTTKAQV